MSLKCGIVGLPNVGKSTLFNALTKAGIAAENYPFCTIEPNVGIVELPDPRLAQAGGDRQAGARRPGDRRVRRHRRAGRRRVQGRRPRQPVPRPHPRDRRHRQRRALLRRRERRPRRRQDRPGLRHRGDPDRALPRRPGDGREERWRATARSPRPAATRTPSALVDVLAKCEAALNEAQPVRSIAVQQGRAGGAEAALPDHREAGDVRRQRRRGRLREQPAPRPAARLRREAACAGGRDLRQDRGRARRHGRRRPADVPRRDGPDRAGPGTPDPRRVLAARTADLLHRRRRRKSAPGRSTSAPPRRRPPA